MTVGCGRIAHAARGPGHALITSHHAGNFPAHGHRRDEERDPPRIRVKGAVRRRGPGWEYYYRELDPGTGRWRQRSKAGFPTRAAATAELRTVLHSMDRGAYVSPTRLTVRAYLEERWLPAITMTVRPSTHASYARNIRLHVVPRLGAVPLQKLDPMMLNDFYLRPEIQTWSPETLRAFLDGTRGDRRHAAWLLLASTGMRRGEALGLRWADVDLRAAQLAIRQTLVTADMVTLFGEPKSRRSRRVVALDTTTIEALQRHRRRQLEEKLALGPAFQDGDLVFARRDGQP